MFEDLLAWAEIDLDAIAANIKAIKQHVGPQVEVIAVLKANAYGHGAVPLAPVVLQAGATRIAVHRAIEGLELRQAGIQTPVLLLGYTPPAAVDLVISTRLTPSVTTIEFAQALSSRSQAAGIITPVHVKVDTGMSRYGLSPSEVVEFTRALSTLPGLSLEGLFTHFATSDATDQIHNRQQLAVFRDVLSGLQQAGLEYPLVHAANSGAMMRLPEAHFQAVRCGISVYGLHPSMEWSPVFKLSPALSLKSRVARVYDLPVGAAVGYGRTFIASHPMRAALVIFGYGDGYHRILSNQSCVLVKGKRAPVIGRVSMDQIVVDISSIPGVNQDDEVVLVGKQGSEQIPAEEVARLAGTINYEVVTSLLPRVTRVYLQAGREVQRTSLGA